MWRIRSIRFSSFLKDIYALVFRLYDAGVSAWISLLVVFLVYALTFLEQTDTVFIALLDRDPLNLALFFILLFFLIQIVAYYPVFIQFNRKTGVDVQWFLKPVLWGLGLITYRQQGVKSTFDSRFRFALGLSLLTAVFYMITRIHYKNVILLGGSDEEIFANNGMAGVRYLALVFFVCGQLFYIALKYVATKQPNFWFNNRPPHRRLFYMALGQLVLCAGALFYSTTVYGWSAWAYYSFCAALFSLSIFYSCFKITRREVLFRTDLQFLYFLSSGGLMSVFVVGVAHIYPLKFNPLVLILAYFLVYYGVLIIPLKHYLYYRQYDEPTAESKRNLAYYLFSWGVPLAPFLFIGYYVYIEYYKGNDLHVLHTVGQQAYSPEKREGPVGIKEFQTEMIQHFEDKDTLYFIALYGGGIKATIWDQLVLAELASEKYSHILDQTVAMSAVSGGAVGMSLFAASDRRGSDSRQLAKTLSMKNFVSLDLTYLLGRDLLFDLLGQPLLDRLGIEEDRSKRAMREYANLTMGQAAYTQGPNPLLDSTFQDIWASLFRERREQNRFYPALLTNSAGTHSQRGIAFSVRSDSLRFQDIFIDSNNLLDFEGTQSLPYLYAASTAERFPIFSPAAKINTKGYFVDGGYFENSGLMSLMDLSNYLESAVFPASEKWKKKKLVFIQIANDKSVFIRDLLKNSSVRKEVHDSPEFGSILETVTSISFISNYLTRKFEQDTSVSYVQVLLPYIVTQPDLDGLFKGSVDTTGLSNLVMQSNRRILKAYQQDLYQQVQPPLARLLGRQAHRYMEQNLQNSRLEVLKVED
ncbi:patatin-like phospholipase [Dyadobacter jejuensis]|uniref:Patatin-like phospholipase n=1 Tax=Dyadobacter jejuensis TaxID=1082580 RepID=A0A316AGJ6_9BACT|nr:patatin-like phospholipase family protein [Dyadobacter jejuensis]PWJ56915.1 patatin-like phospholipase [Dyadobacter jejuensis]